MESQPKTQLYTKLKKDTELTDPLTGEVLKADNPLGLSQAKQRINLQRRELDKAEKWIDGVLAPLVDEAFESGADTFGDFWKIQKGALRFDKDLFYAKASVEEIAQYEEATKLVKELTDKPGYYKASRPSLRYPKL